MNMQVQGKKVIRVVLISGVLRLMILRLITSTTSLNLALE